MAEGEQVDTAFGTVTGDRVTFFTERGWLARGAREDIPLQQVASVRRETSRYVFVGLVLVLIGVEALLGPGAAKVLSAVPFALGALLLWGSPTVVLNTVEGERRPARGWPWVRPEADRFVSAVRARLFEES